MSPSKSTTHGKKKQVPVKAKAKGKAKAKAKAPSKPSAAPVKKAALAPVEVKHQAPAKPGPAKPAPGKPGPAKPAAGAAPATAAPAKPGAKPAVGGKPAKPAKRSGRKSSLMMRRGPDGELLAPGELLLPAGPKGAEETQYLFRGCVAAEHPFVEDGISEVITKRGAESERPDLTKLMEQMRQRFEKGPIEVMLPARGPAKRNFPGVVERAKQRRREIGAFLRGLDLGRTETSHMDSHGEASLQSLMEWAARLENLAEADEPDTADYNQFHRGLDQLDSTTEALIIDVELTLRRLRDRTRAH
jgi:hypothetical protein